MSNIQQVYGGGASITITLASLASSLTAGREGTALDNTVGKYFDAELYLAINLGASAPTGDIFVALTASVDAANYGMNATGSDAGITLVRTMPWDLLEDLRQRGATGIKLPGTSMFYIGRIDCYGQASGATVKAMFGSLAASFGQNLPAKWSIAIFNQTGTAFNATEGNHTKTYNGLYSTSS